MTENEARQMEVEIKWNGRANVCVHCGKVPETYYITTGHDHTDDSIRYCFCRSVAPSIEQLQARVALISQERNGYMEAADRACDERDEFKAKVAELEAENERLKVDRAKKQKESVTIFDVNCELRARVRELEKENARLKAESRDADVADSYKDQLAKAEQRVAEACALQVATETKFHWLDAARVAKEIRSGEWRKFMKGE